MKKIIIWTITLGWAALTFYLTTIPNFSPSPDTLLSWLMSNGGHFIFFGIQAVLFFLSFPPHLFMMDTSISAAITTSLFGIFIEFLQLNIPGRSFSLEDWALDILGTTIFLYLYKKSRFSKFSIY